MIRAAAKALVALLSVGAASCTRSRLPGASTAYVVRGPRPALASQRVFVRTRGVACATASVEKEKPQQGPPVHLGWDTHKPVSEAPDSLVRGVEGNESMRRRFEQACRRAQVGSVHSLEAPRDSAL
jgi:hypothetical protein